MTEPTEPELDRREIPPEFRATREHRRSWHGGRRRWDLPPNVTKVLIAWAVIGPSLVAWLKTSGAR